MLILLFRTLHHTAWKPSL